MTLLPIIFQGVKLLIYFQKKPKNSKNCLKVPFLFFSFHFYAGGVIMFHYKWKELKISEF